MANDRTGHGPRAVVVGAGVGGLAAAIGLRQIGWQPIILERSTAPGGIGAGVSLWSNALDALDALGVGEAVRRAGTLQSGGGFRTPDGRWLTRSSGAALLERFGVALLLMHRAQLHRELLAALPTDAVVAGTNVTDLAQTADHVVVGYDGPTGRAETRADLVVGADGVHSTVRRRLWPEAPPPKYAGFTAWRGVTDEPIDIEGEAAETWAAAPSSAPCRWQTGGCTGSAPPTSPKPPPSSMNAPRCCAASGTGTARSRPWSTPRRPPRCCTTTSITCLVRCPGLPAAGWCCSATPPTP